MAANAGFAAALTIRQNALDDALLIGYGTSVFPKTFVYPLLPGPPGASVDPAANIDLFLSPPHVNCSDTGLTLSLELLGGLTVTDSTGTSQARGVDAVLDVTLVPELTLKTPSGQAADLGLVLTIEASALTVTGFSYEVVFGTAYPSDVEDYLASADFRARLQAMLALAFTKPLTVPAVPLSFLGDDLLGAIDQSFVAWRVVNGALMVGFDIAHYETPSGEIVILNGDTGALADFAGSNDVAAAIGVGAVPVLLQSAESQVRTQIASAGASLDAFSMTAGDGKFHVAATASNDEGTVTISFAIAAPFIEGVRPGLVSPLGTDYPHVNQRTYAALGFVIEDVDVSATTSLLVNILATAFSLIGGWWMVDSMVGRQVHGTAAQIEGASTNGPSPRVQRWTPADPGNVTLRIALQEFAISVDGTLTGLALQMNPTPAALLGPRAIPDDLKTSSLTYTARLPLGVQAEDPALRIHWTVTDATSGAVLYDDDDGAAGRTVYTLVPATLSAQTFSFTVACRVYRTLGSAPDTLDASVTLEIGVPRPTGGYVRWLYSVKPPRFSFDETTQSWSQIAPKEVYRTSKLHRTDHPCKMATRRSRFVAQTDTLDSLPFPVADIDANRDLLCDYCFYGGPAGLNASI